MYFISWKFRSCILHVLSFKISRKNLLTRKSSFAVLLQLHCKEHTNGKFDDCTNNLLTDLQDEDNSDLNRRKCARYPKVVFSTWQLNCFLSNFMIFFLQKLKWFCLVKWSYCFVFPTNVPPQFETSFIYFPLSCAHCYVIYQTQKTVFENIPKHQAEYFWRVSKCLDCGQTLLWCLIFDVSSQSKLNPWR